ncbi:MAG TPA: hypothetical protein VML75_11980 [Kofleriaceae bacterium]|nr:hypothetical protein [Kofleriaceae bacterium]
MDNRDDDAPLESRPPTIDDLVDLCRHLNEEGARYIVIGGMAILQLGFVRATEDIVVDLMKSACGIQFDEARDGIVGADVQGVTIPFAGPALLWRLKQTVRAKDQLDREFLARLLSHRT